MEKSDVLEMFKRDPVLFLTRVLDVKQEHVWGKMREICESIRDNQFTAVKAGNSLSKALELSTLIQTEDGLRPIANVSIGDKVYSERGELVDVVDDSGIFEDDCYEIKFDDGASVVAHSGHLWNVLDFQTRKAIRRRKTLVNDFKENWDLTKTVTTEWISKNLKYISSDGGNKNNLSIPTIKPIDGELDLEFPYTLGFWLGDGTRGNGQITMCPEDAKEVVPKIEAEGFTVNKQQCNKFGYRVSAGKGMSRKSGSLAHKLRKLGLIRDKQFLPWFINLRMSTKLKLIQGFLDADGYKLQGCNSAGLGLTDKLLFETFVPFLSSTGVKVFEHIYIMQYNEEDKNVYVLNFSPEYQPFGLKRKQLSLKRISCFRQSSRMIMSVEPVGKKQVKCISVTGEHSLFACTKYMIPTHNSYTIARIALWFLYTHRPSTVVTTAPSNTQVEEIIWREIRSAHSAAKVPLGGEPLKASLDLQKYYKDKHKWFATGFSTRPDTVTQQATRFQGFHNENVLIIFDEAAGVEPEIWEAKDKLVTNPQVKFVAIGNPTVATGDFVNCFKDSHYNKITVSVYDSPNYKQGRVVVPGLSGREFVEQTIAKYGKDSNHYKAMVTGEIPDNDIDSLIPISWIEAAENREEIEPKYKFTKKFVVWDVADGGDDAHVIKAFENTTEIEEVIIRQKKIEEVEPYVWRLLRKVQGNCIIVDSDGIGRVATSLLEQAKDDKTTIIAFEGSSKDVYEPNLFMNKRHESHWKMREMFEQNKICLNSCPEQKEELAATKIVGHRKGFIAIEPKKDLKRRIGRSPDRGDTIMMMCGCFNEIPIVSRGDSYSRKITIDLEDDYCFNPMTV